MLTAVLLLQTTTHPPLQAGASDFDVRQVAPLRCGEGAGDDIVVCGREPQHRLKPVEERFGPKPVRAEVRLGKAKGMIRAEQQAFGATASNRVMFTLKLPF